MDNWKQQFIGIKSLSRKRYHFKYRQNTFENEVKKIIKSIEMNWKNNLIDTRVYNEVDLIIPLNSFNSTKLQKELLFNDKSIKVNSTLILKIKVL